MTTPKATLTAPPPPVSGFHRDDQLADFELLAPESLRARRRRGLEAATLASYAGLSRTEKNRLGYLRGAIRESRAALEAAQLSGNPDRIAKAHAWLQQRLANHAKALKDFELDFDPVMGGDNHDPRSR